MTATFLTGVTYWPAETGPYLWHEFDAGTVRSDLARIRDQGLGTVRVPLGWDAFMTTDRRVNPVRLGQLGGLLDAAAALGLAVVPVLFAQSVGDCVTLPDYAILPRGARRGVRVLSGGRARSGGPRDMYADPLMLEMQTRWLEGMLEQCAGHPALAAWDLGHDPASTIRPRLFADLRAWVTLLAEQVHAAGDRCWLTLGAGDLLTARGVRLGLVADRVDAVGLSLMPQLLGLGGDRPSAHAVTFLCRLAQSLLGERAASLVVSSGVADGAVGSAEAEPGPAGLDAGAEERGTLRPRRVRRSPLDPEPVDPVAAAEHAALLLRALPAAGVQGALAWTWTGLAGRARLAPPFDRFPSLGRCGLVDGAGELTGAGEAWAAAARRGGEPAVAAPWPARLDEEDYYSHLPESALELFSTSLDVPEHDPAILR